MRRTIKALSLDQQVDSARRAVYAAIEMSRSAYYRTYGDMPEAYPILVYDTYVIVQEGLAYFKVAYTVDTAGVTVQPRAEWELVDQTWVPASPAPATKSIRGLVVVKAASDAGDDWVLDVLAAPFGGPLNGKDLHDEYFDAATKFHEDKWPLPPAVYYHGFDPQSNAPAGEPEYIGRSTTRTVKSDGVWYRVILNKTSAGAKRVWDAAKRGFAAVSSGSIAHLTRTEADGHITHWPIAEISIWDGDTTGRKQANAYAIAVPAAVKALYGKAGMALPSDIDPPQATLTGGGDPQRSHASAGATQPITGVDMDEEELKRLIASTVASALKSAKEEEDAAVAAQAAIQTRIDDAVKAATTALAAEWARGNRLPDGTGVEVGTPLKYAETRKFDNLDPQDLAIVIGVLEGHLPLSGKRPSEAAYKALAIKLDESQTQTGEYVRNAFKSMGVKANEVQYSTLASYGDEWVSVAYSNAIWEGIRQGTFVVDMLPQVEVPQGAESIVMPMEGADPTWYKVPQTTSTNATTGTPDATVPSSRMGTLNNTLTVAKMGARVLWSGELGEDSIIPFAQQLRQQLQSSGAEMLEHAVIDGDTDATATTNINDIGGTPAVTDLFLLIDGFRKLALITNTANKRDGGTLTSGDFLATAKLLGAAGVNALDIAKVGLISDVNIHWAALELADVKSRDVFTAATIETGKLAGIYGYKHFVSPWMHYMSAVRKANTAGKVDRTTPANNTTGSILAVRWDQWRLGWKRRMTIETTRVPRSDHTEIVALARVGLKYRDTEASAISYNITVS